jgi:predicted nucleotidyltransferase
MANSALLAMPDSGPVSAKKLCYLLRALFACRHILHCRTQPPTAFALMLECLSTDAQERAWIDAVLHAKAAAPENATIALSAAQRLALSAEIAVALEARATIGGAQKTPPEALDEVLRGAVLGFAGLA